MSSAHLNDSQKDPIEAPTHSNFDVRLLPLKDIFSSAPLESLQEWFYTLTYEITHRQKQNVGKHDFDYCIQYALVGPKGSGKSNMRLMFSENVFRMCVDGKRGIDYSKVFLNLEDFRVKLSLWDTPWNEFTVSYINSAAVVLLVFDVTDKNSYSILVNFIEKHEQSLKPSNCKIFVLIGNKVDMPGREVFTEESYAFAKSKGFLYIETSAKIGKNLKEVFINTAKQILLKIKMGAIDPSEAVGIRRSANEGKDKLIVSDWGTSLLRNAVLNKAEAFTDQEREELGLNGLLPPRVLDLETQAKRCYQQFKNKSGDVERYIYLESLHDRNETVYYKLLVEHIEEMMPIVYTPVVGKACQLYGYIYRQPRGLYFNISSKGQFKNIVHNSPTSDARIIVVTDGSRILGLGDLGANGMGIPIGKLSLYVACAGIDPSTVTPCLLDFGTDNGDILQDPFYLGERRPRPSLTEFQAVVDEFIDAVRSRWHNVLIQFEDFAFDKAFPLLRKYQDQILCFNDDIQGTGSVALAGLMTCMKFLNQNLTDQKILFAGAGSAALGIGDMVSKAMVEEGLSLEDANGKMFFYDLGGLLTVHRKDVSEFQKPFCKDMKDIKDFCEVVKACRPTVLMGLTGAGSMFTSEIIQFMMTYCDNPMVFALSNPTDKAEITAENAYLFSKGKAVFASGSPFEPVEYEGQLKVPAQGNNMYIFPGVGLGAIVGKLKYIPDSVFYVAAKALSEMVTAEDWERGSIYPKLDKIREISLNIACATISHAFEKGLACIPKPPSVRALVEASMWNPAYASYEIDPDICSVKSPCSEDSFHGGRQESNHLGLPRKQKVTIRSPRLMLREFQ